MPHASSVDVRSAEALQVWLTGLGKRLIQHLVSEFRLLHLTWYLRPLETEKSLAINKRTPLYAVHKALGARLIPFGGWEMPVEYSGISREHAAVRTAAGIFDVSHMGEFDVRGPEALDLIQSVTTNDAS